MAAEEQDQFEETAEEHDREDSDVQAEAGSAEEDAPAESEEAAGQGYDEASPKKWYIIHTYSGFENKVKESLQTRADAFGFADKVGRILIPTEEEVELRNGKKVTSKRLVY